jgi:transposase
MDIRYFIGIDVSKSTLDWAVFDGRTIAFESHSANTETGIKQTLRAISGLEGFSVPACIVCLEHTGIYNALLLAELAKSAYPIWLESSGIGRPTSDQTSGRSSARQIRPY